MEAPFLGELSERLFVHFTGGRWSAPLSDRLLPVAVPRAGHLVCGGAADVARALEGVVQGQGGNPEGLQAALGAVAADAAMVRRAEGFADPWRDGERLMLPGQGPLVLLSAADAPLSLLAQVLVGGAARGVVWKPAPGAAASAHWVMRALGPLAGGKLALVQGDHATGALMAGAGALIWASGGAVPSGVGAPVLTLAARAPRCR